VRSSPGTGTRGSAWRTHQSWCWPSGTGLVRSPPWTTGTSTSSAPLMMAASKCFRARVDPGVGSCTASGGQRLPACVEQGNRPGGCKGQALTSEAPQGPARRLAWDRLLSSLRASSKKWPLSALWSRWYRAGPVSRGSGPTEPAGAVCSGVAVDNKKAPRCLRRGNGSSSKPCRGSRAPVRQP
jgi:hypothetical protein